MKMQVDNSIFTFRKSLSSFCNHLQSSCDALKQSLERRPIPLDSASSTFIQCVNRRVSSASTDLNVLESMSLGIVSFEELLGHCSEVYKKNQSDLVELEDSLKRFGYVPDEQVEDGDSILATPVLGSKFQGEEDGPPSIMKALEEDPLFEESLSLKNLGISDVCLATLAPETNGDIDKADVSLRYLMKHSDTKLDEVKGSYQCAANISAIDGGEEKACLGSVGANKSLINVEKDDYDNLPSYIKTLASWEDLLSAVEKMNSTLKNKEKPKGSYLLQQDEITSLGLGPKGRSYLLLLVRMNRLIVETNNGSIFYRVL